VVAKHVIVEVIELVLQLELHFIFFNFPLYLQQMFKVMYKGMQKSAH
jgi:hypothetical protein